MGGRNANGEGTIYRRKDGRWEASIYLPTASGRRKRFCVYSKTREDAHKRLVEAKQRVQQGIPMPDKSWRLAEYLDHWLQRAKRRALTLRRHESIVRLYIKPQLGGYHLEQLSVHIVQTFLDGLHKDGKSTATVFQVRKVLSAALTYAMRQELIFRNVARLVEMPEYRPREALHWSLDETTRFLEAARPDPLYATFVLLALYGLRRGEVLGIRWRDVDFEQGILHIRQQVQRIGKTLQQVELKTVSSRRNAPLLEMARKVLLQQQRDQAVVRTAAGKLWLGAGADDLVFTTRSGRPVESRNLYRSFLRICERHGLRRITVHGLRHSNATAQKELQVHARDTQAILGHGDVRTTGLYEHVDMASKRNALEKVERTLFQGAGNGGRCRQVLPSTPNFVAISTSVVSGGSSQTRTGDTRLFRSTSDSGLTPIAEVALELRARTKLWLLGRVAVKNSRQVVHGHSLRDPMEVWTFITRWLDRTAW